MLTNEEREAEHGRADHMGWAVWQPHRCDNEDLLDLYGFRYCLTKSPEHQ